MGGATIYFIRHGQTDWNAELRFQGQRDVPLNDIGLAQARDNGRRLARLLSDVARVDFVASPLGRARATMEIMRQAMGLDPAGYRIDERLVEASYGTLEGTTLAEFKARFPEVHRHRKRERWHFRPPGGESHAMVLERVLPWLHALERDTVVSAHGVVGRVLRHHLLGIEPNAAAAYAFPQDRICVWRDGVETLV